jgi:predicted DCC family thiol-disulfide oxidoreductase YuxK
MVMINRIILFDGVCNLCNASVKFIIKNDPEALFKFAPLQSQFARKILIRNNICQGKYESLILVVGDNVFLKSTAALKIARNLKAPWPVFYPLIIIPWPVRDIFYNLIAKHRYRLFGQKDSCMIPSKEIKNRFLM